MSLMCRCFWHMFRASPILLLCAESHRASIKQINEAAVSEAGNSARAERKHTEGDLQRSWRCLRQRSWRCLRRWRTANRCVSGRSVIGISFVCFMLKGPRNILMLNRPCGMLRTLRWCTSWRRCWAAMELELPAAGADRCPPCLRLGPLLLCDICKRYPWEASPSAPRRARTRHPHAIRTCVIELGERGELCYHELSVVLDIGAGVLAQPQDAQLLAGPQSLNLRG
jgi:hypothetical protein